MGISELREWANSAFGETQQDLSRVTRAVRELSRELAKAIAERPNSLNEVEWRDLERVLAEVFEKLGFGVEITPPAKDGGKDIVLSCIVTDRRESFLVEVKHWVSGKRVGQRTIKEFLNVVAKEKAESGLVLSTSGYSKGIIEGLTIIEREKVRLGSRRKIISLCQTYVRAEAGIWSPPIQLPDVVFSETD
jgi:restriction endonuclease Mrr